MNFVGAKNKKDMYPEELKTASHIKLPMEAWRDHKKLTKFLGDVEKTMNK
jgi:hypothetical protein